MPSGFRSAKPTRGMASSMAGNSGLPGEIVGSGRAADVYALDAERVLRRYRTPHSCAAEAALMRYLRAAGYPVPEVLGADGPDLVMERLHGREMLADMAARPWRAARHARTWRCCTTGCTTFPRRPAFLIRSAPASESCIWTCTLGLSC